MSQQINGETFKTVETGVLYSETGDITINASNVVINGLIYAPQGTVTVNAGTVDLMGLIVAKRILINADTITEQPARDLKGIYEELQIDFYPEILTTCDENNQVEIYGGNINIKNMIIYVRENNEPSFREIVEIAGNEYTFTVSGETQCMDIRVKCTNIFGQTEFSDITSLVRTEGVMQNTVVDSDGDELPDGYEIWDLKTDVYNADSDGDGLTDGYEILYSHTDPLVADQDTDSDGDGLTALEEYEQGTNPLYKDTDFDGNNDFEDEDPLTTEVLADQSEYQTCDFEPELGVYDLKKMYLDINGNIQVQIFNEITKDEYYDNNAGREFLRVSDADDRVESVIFSDGNGSDIETYEYDSEGRKTTWAVNGDVYQYEYDDEENTEVIYLNNTYINTVTSDKNDNKTRVEYANGTTLDYKYSEEGAVTSLSVDGETAYIYEYPQDNIVRVIDVCLDKTSEVVYEEEGNTTYNSGDGLIISKATEERDNSLINKENINWCGVERNSIHTFEDDSGINSIKTEYVNGTNILIERGEKDVSTYLIGKKTIPFINIEYDEDGRIEVLTNLLGNYHYTYDYNGNLTMVEKNDILQYEYVYNEKNQLAGYVDYENEIIYIYQYDNNNNILNVKKTDIDGALLSEQVYGYDEDDAMGVQTYNKNSIMYDKSGNPLIYYNGMIMEWKNGRILEQIHEKELDITYTYNCNGMRVAKNVNGIETNYLRDDTDKLLGEITGANIMWYLYDGVENLVGFELNGQEYYYVRNSMGDVEGIVDKEGNILCTYSYDAWGKVLEISGDMELAKKNPVRYRGYYYDEESGFYYLCTRYYDPEIKRFINRDILDNGSNLYQYCYNNPVISSDYNGKSSNGVSDSYLTIVQNIYGYSYKYMNHISTYWYHDTDYLNFNCYLWVWTKLYVNCPYNTVSGYPGVISGFLKPTNETFSYYVGNVICDIKSAGYKLQSSSTVYPTIRNGYKVIAMKMQNSNSGDYHFMKLNSATSKTWSFKAGWGGCVFNINSKYTPNNIDWCSYKYVDGIWVRTSPYYNSHIQYFVYK